MKNFFSSAIIALVIVIFFAGCGNANSKKFDGTANGTGFFWSNSSKKASKNANLELIGSENRLVIDLTETDFDQVEITLSGKNSGKRVTRKNGLALSSITDTFTKNGLEWLEGTVFNIDCTAFEDGETVVVEAILSKDSSFLENAFGKGQTKKYWAFIARHSEASEEASENDESSSTKEEGTSAAGTDSSAKTEAPSTEEDSTGNETTSGSGIIDSIISGINSVTGNNSTDESGVPVVDKEPNGVFLIEGFQLGTYPTQELAAAHVQGLPKKLSIGSTIQGVPTDNTARIKVWVENGHGGMSDVEYLLTADNNWTATMELAQLSGQAVTLGIVYQSYGIFPKMTFEYVTVEIP